MDAALTILLWMLVGIVALWATVWVVSATVVAVIAIRGRRPTITKTPVRPYDTTHARPRR